MTDELMGVADFGPRVVLNVDLTRARTEYIVGESGPETFEPRPAEGDDGAHMA